MPYNKEYESKKMRNSGMSEYDITLTNMKREKSSSYSDMPKSVEESHDDYPYGLELRLDNETLDKLGIQTMKDVGEYCYIHAVAKVKSTSERQDEYDEGDAKRDMCLQITKMAVDDYEMDED
jgi:hypothetical protein